MTLEEASTFTSNISSLLQMIVPDDNLNVAKEGRFSYYPKSKDFYLNHISVPNYFAYA